MLISVLMILIEHGENLSTQLVIDECVKSNDYSIRMAWNTKPDQGVSLGWEH